MTKGYGLLCGLGELSAAGFAEDLLGWRLEDSAC